MAGCFFEYIIPLIIPAYEPGNDMLSFCEKLKNTGFKEIIIIDDGSGMAYRRIFDEIELKYNYKVLRHAVNLGKGRAIKTAFNYVLNNLPNAIGAVTADSDGQHTPEDIKKCMQSLMENTNSLVLGCRDFGKDGIPWKSKFGNELTKKALAYLCGLKVSDTQTGLRGIPRDFMIQLMNISGERFEFETNMLLESKEKYNILEVPIETIYDSKRNHKTHFDPFRDSIIIYKVIFSYSLSSVMSTVVDFIVFAIANGYGMSIGGATAIARICASAINFLLNKRVVFKAKGNAVKQLVQYMLLVAFSGCVSALAISGLTKLISIEVIGIKAAVETCLFFFNYYMQRKYIFVRPKD